MIIPEIIATRSLKCNGNWLTVDIEGFGGLEYIPANGGDYAGRFCRYGIKDGPIPFLAVGVDAAKFCHLDDEQKQLARLWMPKAGLLTLIEVLCGQPRPQVKSFAFIPFANDLSIDPQKTDMRFFRTRCRHDVLRVIHDQLMSPEGVRRLSLSDVIQSPLLTRLYEGKDVVTAMSYWARNDILINGTMGPRYDIDEQLDEEVSDTIEAYDWEESVSADKVEQDKTGQIDAFICHASEDKDGFVRRLAEALREQGLSIWYDEHALKLGDSLRQSIDRGLASSRFGVVVLSKAFFAKKWPQYELDGLVERQINGQKVILPIWHKVTHEDVRRYSPSLANRVAVESSLEMPKIVESIIEVIRPSS